MQATQSGSASRQSLLQLPSELLQHVGQHLSAAALVATQLACQQTKASVLSDRTTTTTHVSVDLPLPVDSEAHTELVQACRQSVRVILRLSHHVAEPDTDVYDSDEPGESVQRQLAISAAEQYLARAAADLGHPLNNVDHVTLEGLLVQSFTPAWLSKHCPDLSSLSLEHSSVRIPVRPTDREPASLPTLRTLTTQYFTLCGGHLHVQGVLNLRQLAAVPWALATSCSVGPAADTGLVAVVMSRLQVDNDMAVAQVLSRGGLKWRHKQPPQHQGRNSAAGNAAWAAIRMEHDYFAEYDDDEDCWEASDEWDSVGMAGVYNFMQLLSSYTPPTPAAGSVTTGAGSRGPGAGGVSRRTVVSMECDCELSAPWVSLLGSLPQLLRAAPDHGLHLHLSLRTAISVHKGSVRSMATLYTSLVNSLCQCATLSLDIHRSWGNADSVHPDDVTAMLTTWPRPAGLLCHFPFVRGTNPQQLALEKTIRNMLAGGGAGSVATGGGPGSMAPAGGSTQPNSSTTQLKGGAQLDAASWKKLQLAGDTEAWSLSLRPLTKHWFVHTWHGVCDAAESKLLKDLAWRTLPPGQ